MRLILQYTLGGGYAVNTPLIYSSLIDLQQVIETSLAAYLIARKESTSKKTPFPSDILIVGNSEICLRDLLIDSLPCFQIITVDDFFAEVESHKKMV